MTFPISNFWNYSIQAWQQPGVETACLTLQDRHALDVNLMLYCCWTGSQHLSLTHDNILLLLKTIECWQQMIKPLRESRKQLRISSFGTPAGLIEQTLSNLRQIELNAEHMAQIALEDALDMASIPPLKNASRVECSLCNLLSYIHTQPAASALTSLIPTLLQLLASLYPGDNSVETAFDTLSTRS